MDLHQLIIHELAKEAASTEVELHLSKRALPVDEQAVMLLDRLYDTFMRKSEVLSGQFAGGETAPEFARHFQELVDADLEAQSFVTFSEETTRALGKVLEGQSAAKGGYLIYAHFSWMENNYLGIYLVRNTEGLYCDQNDGESVIQLDTTTYLDLDRLAMAALIHLDWYAQPGKRFLQVIRHARSQTSISDYFLDWLGLEEPESNRDSTRVFLDALEELPLPTDQESGHPMAEDHFREEVYAYAMAQPSRQLDAHQFDRHFYGEDQAPLQAYLDERPDSPGQGFYFDGAGLRHHNRIQVKGEGVSLSFLRNAYRDGLISMEGDRVIIHSASLADKIRELL